ncbi:MAG: cell wall metabolism sensor histidine kinase WalK, partial [bacterium]|nr:cell wall metabolism sensor histidine kinase WalK [bacterium]
MKLSNMKLGVRLGLGFGSILVIFCVAVFLTTVFLGMVDRNSHTVIDESFPHALLAAEMAFDVVQVQQWLTDVSVSHDEAGYQDAEEAANGFRDGVTIFQQLYTTKNDTESLKQLEALEIAFEHYYDEGKIMAEIYVSQGREAGNSAMKDFDDVAETLTHKIEQFKNEQIEDASTMMETIVSAVDNVRNVLLALSGLAVVVGFLIASLISRSITRPITKVVEAATAIAEGDLSKDIDIYQKDEIGSLAHVFRNMNGKIHDVLEEMNILIQTVQNGRLDNRGSTDAFAGSWRDLVIGMNNLIDAFVMPVNITATYLDRIAKGDVPDKITEEVNGDFNKIKNNLNLLIDNIGNVLQETNGLNQAVQDGKLDTRGNAKTFVGDWKELVESMNTVIDAFVAPLNMTAGSLDRIAKGDIPDTITEEYKGDFNQVKNNLNTLIDAMNEITQLAKGMA